MAGNIAERCWDWYPRYEDVTRVVRGGCWCFIPYGCRVGNRGDSDPLSADLYNGFRAVLSTNTVHYLVVDLSGGPNAASYPVSYLSAVPGGGWTDEYKTTKLVLRHIPAGKFTMGSPLGELGRDGDETQHKVKLTKDFYMGVFEVTQKQWELVMGTWPSFFNNASYRDSRPVEQVSYYDIRENPNNTAISSNWPQSSQVHADSFMGKLRAKTGMAFDLPTESQWEYAGRAGTTKALNSGKNLTDFYRCPNLAEVGRYEYNGGSGHSEQNGNTSVATAKVGSYLPNAWGLYDIHGNVWEWCLDWYRTYYPTAVENVNPAGAATGSDRLRRGGCLSVVAGDCNSANRGTVTPSVRNYSTGFRVARIPPSAPWEVGATVDTPKMPLYLLTVTGRNLLLVESMARNAFGQAFVSAEKVESPRTRSERLTQAKTKIEQAKDIIMDLQAEMQAWYDGMPENLQSSRKADKVSGSADALQEAVDALDGVDFGSVTFP
jgi:formylglycine-generating enzyme required for sulfatase activity